MVGDIIDFWCIQRRMYWPKSHNEIVQKILSWSNNDVDVYYLPGNHDELFLSWSPIKLGNITVLEDTVHTGADGKQYLVLHGDSFDGVVHYQKWLAVVGDIGYKWLQRINACVSYVRGKLGKDAWSFSSFIKKNVKKAANFVARYENSVTVEAKKNNYDGVICGHIHYPDIKDMGGALYVNCGDWIESCTAVVEHWDGKLEIIKWQMKPKTN